MFKLYQNKNSILVINLVISIFLISGHTYSQACPPMTKSSSQITNTENLSTKRFPEHNTDTVSPLGIIVDKTTQEPIAGATVRWVGSQNATATNNEGRFAMCAAPVKENKLEISSIGYETLIVDNPPLDRSIRYQLSPIYKELESVTFIGKSSQRIIRKCWSIRYHLKGRELKLYQPDSYCEFRCGVSGVQVLGLYSLQDTLKSPISSKDIKLYPNPVYAGVSVNFELNKVDAGVYKVEVFDASGKLVQSENVNVVFKNQTISISTSPSWSKGTYLIRLSGTKTNSVHVGKLVLR